MAAWRAPLTIQREPPASAGAPGLAAVLLLCALVAAGAASRVMWHRNVRRRHSQMEHGPGETQRLLQMRQLGGATAGLGDVTRADGPPDRGRQAQLAALVKATFGDGAAHSISILDLVTLPATIAHHVGAKGSDQHAAAAAVAHADPQQQTQQQGWSMRGSSSAPASRQWRLDTRSLQLSPEGVMVRAAAGLP